jgi:uncharacterized ion transporter superfamily protein YfcC
MYDDMQRLKLQWKVCYKFSQELKMMFCKHLETIIVPLTRKFTTRKKTLLLRVALTQRLMKWHLVPLSWFMRRVRASFPFYALLLSPAPSTI